MDTYVATHARAEGRSGSEEEKEGRWARTGVKVAPTVREGGGGGIIREGMTSGVKKREEKCPEGPRGREREREEDIMMPSKMQALL